MLSVIHIDVLLALARSEETGDEGDADEEEER
jgi:hypothetical protein